MSFDETFSQKVKAFSKIFQIELMAFLKLTTQFNRIYKNCFSYSPGFILLFAKIDLTFVCYISQIVSYVMFRFIDER